MLTYVSDAVCVDRVEAVFELADTEMGMADSRLLRWFLTTTAHLVNEAPS